MDLSHSSSLLNLSLTSRGFPCGLLVHPNIWHNSVIFNRIFFRAASYVQFKSFKKKASCCLFHLFLHFLRPSLPVCTCSRRGKEGACYRELCPRNIKPFVAFLLQAEGSHFSLHFFFSMATTWHPPRLIRHTSASCCCHYQLKLGNGLRSLFQRWLSSPTCTSSVDLKGCWKLPATMAPSLATAQPVTPREWIPFPGHQLPLRLGESEEPLCPGTLRLHFGLSNTYLGYRLLELITPQDGLSLSHAYPFFFVRPSWPWPAFI